MPRYDYLEYFPSPLTCSKRLNKSLSERAPSYERSSSRHCHHLILVCVQPFSTTLFRGPFPLPTPQGRQDSQLRTTGMPNRGIRTLRKAIPRTRRLGLLFGKSIKEGVPGLLRGPSQGSKAKSPRRKVLMIPSDCLRLLPAMDLADKRLRRCL